MTSKTTIIIQLKLDYNDAAHLKRCFEHLKQTARWYGKSVKLNRGRK